MLSLTTEVRLPATWRSRSGGRATGERGSHGSGRSEGCVSSREDGGVSTKTDVLLADEAPICGARRAAPAHRRGPGRGFLTFEQIAVDLGGGRGHEGAGPGAPPAPGGAGHRHRRRRRPARHAARRRRSRPPPRRRASPAPTPPKKPEIDLTVEPSLDSLRLYLRSIGRVPLLTAEQEVDAGQAHRARRHGRQAADGRGQPAPRRLDRQGLPGPRADVPGPDPGGLARASSARSRSSTTAAATSSRPTPPGGSARP